MEPNISDHLPSELQRGFEEFPTMHGIDLHGGAAASVPGSLLANPVHFSHTPIVHPRLRRARTRPRSAGSGWTVKKWD
jgi:hypothetical protein